MHWLKKSLRPQNHLKKKSVAHLTLNVFLFQIVRQQTEMTHQQQVSRSVSCIIRAEREHFEHMQ